MLKQLGVSAFHLLKWGKVVEEKQVCGRNQGFSVKPEKFLQHLRHHAQYTAGYTGRRPSCTCAAQALHKDPQWHLLRTLHKHVGHARCNTAVI